MGLIIGIFGLMALTLSDDVQEFVKHSNGSDQFTIVMPRSCETGLRESGFTWSLGGNMVLKQNNPDGTIGDVCVKDEE